MSKVDPEHSTHHKKIHTPDVSSNIREYCGMYGWMCSLCEEDKGRTEDFNWKKFVENGYLDDQAGELLFRRTSVIMGLKHRVILILLVSFFPPLGATTPIGGCILQPSSGL